MSTESTMDQEQRRSIPWASILIAGIASIVLSMAANLVVRSIAIRAADIPGGFEPMSSAGNVVTASISYGVFAIIAYTITYRFARDLRRTWLIVGVAGLVVSFIPALTTSSQDGATTAGVATLVIMHIVAAAITIPLMLRLAGDR